MEERKRISQTKIVKNYNVEWENCIKKSNYSRSC